MKYMFMIGYCVVIVGLIIMSIARDQQVEFTKHNTSFDNNTIMNLTLKDENGDTHFIKIDGKEYTKRLIGTSKLNQER